MFQVFIILTGTFAFVRSGNFAHLSLVSEFRVFSDRLIDHKDLEEFVALLEKTLTSHFDLQFDGICPEKQTPIFGYSLSFHSKQNVTAVLWSLHCFLCNRRLHERIQHL